MDIEIKNTKKPIEYIKAIRFLEERIDNILKHNEKELIWILEHKKVFTGGVPGTRSSDIQRKFLNLRVRLRLDTFSKSSLID